MKYYPRGKFYGAPTTTRVTGPRPDPALRRPAFACAIEYERLFDLFSHQRAGPGVICGWHAILRYLNDTLGMRSWFGYRITRRQVETWIAVHGFPFLPGVRRPSMRYQCVTLERAVDAWILSRPRNGVRELFAFKGDGHVWLIDHKRESRRSATPLPAPTSPSPPSRTLAAPTDESQNTLAPLSHHSSRP